MPCRASNTFLTKRLHCRGIAVRRLTLRHGFHERSMRTRSSVERVRHGTANTTDHETAAADADAGRRHPFSLLEAFGHA